MKTYIGNSPEFLVAYAKTLDECECVRSVTNSKWQRRLFRESQEWVDIPKNDYPIIGGHIEYRLKPNLIVINGTELPAPMSEPPTNESIYYFIAANAVECVYWRDSETDKARLNNGRAFASKEDAEAVHQFLVKLFTQ